MKRLTLGARLLVLVMWATLYLLTGPPTITKAGQNNPAGGKSPSANTPQSSGPPSANRAPTSASGITGGSMAIESTIFAYRALTADADKISEAIKPKVQDQTVVIATPADFTSLVQWRTVMYQAGLLHKRAQSATKSLEDIPIPPLLRNPPTKEPPRGFVTSPADVQALIQTLASVFAVTQSLSVSSGALTSTPLTNLLAGQLRHNGIAAYVPSVYTPNLLRRDNLEDTFIGESLCQLEDDRQKAANKVQEYSQALTYAQMILSEAAPSITNLSPTSGSIGTVVTITGTNFGSTQGTNKVEFNGTTATVTSWSATSIVAPVPTGTTTGNVVVTVEGKASNGVSFTVSAAAPQPPQAPRAPAAPPAPPKSTYSPEQKAEAATFQASVNLKVAALASIVAAIDTFEATLFTGQPSSAPNQGNNAPSGSTANNPPGGPATIPVPPVQGNPPAATNPPSPAATPSGPSTAGSPLQEILASDLLAHQIWNGVERPSDEDLKKLHILIVQTLESGGGQLTKSNLFLGSRIYFSGGTVATFALYRVDGALECGGYAYAYGGYAKDDEFGKMIQKSIDPTIVRIDSFCQ